MGLGWGGGGGADLSSVIVRPISYGFRKGEMPVTKRQVIITCIPKEGKDKTLLNYRRPITLLNIVQKIASSCIAERLKTVLPQFIMSTRTDS